MIISITGYSGFVGKNLSNYLIENYIDVKKLSLRDKNWKKLLDKNSDAIIHLAGKAHDTQNISDPSQYFKINRDLTIELFNEFLKSEIKDFIFFSSVKAVADSVSGVLKEDVIPNPLTPYGQSKLEAEQYMLNQYLPKGKRLFIIRPCMVHGPRNKGNLNLLYKIVEKGIPWPLVKFENQRSFIGMDNLCFFIFSIINNDRIGSGIYNVSDDEAISTNKLISIINNTLGKKTRFLSINKKFIQNIAKIGDKLSLPINSERLKKLTESYVVSNQKIKRALEIEKLPLTAEEGLIKTIESFKKK